MDVIQAIKVRRSVRKFKPDPVSDDLLNAVLEAGRWAPSWANTQCWRFVVVRDPEIKAKLAETKTGNNPAVEAIRIAPVTIVICAELKKSGYYKGEAPTDKGDWFMFDAALAAQNMMLAAHSFGLGTVPVGLFNAPKAAEVLGVPQNVAVVLMMPLGYPAEKPITPRRKELSEIVVRDRFK
ncbi:MAG: nitroreductase [Chloroflexi bacterium]|nr:nitroreductase [Chloroflexota bacterium]